MDRDTLQMAREAKAARDEDGTPDERADTILALWEAGITAPLAGVTVDTMKAWLADPASAPGGRVLPAIPTSGDDGAPRVRRGGEPASNQFGTFEVHQASPKQIAFAKRLLAEKDLGDIKVPADIDTISKKAASALIDRLMGRPAKADTGTAPADRTAQAHGPRLASDKQMAFLNRLIGERDYSSLLVADRAKVDFIKGGGTPTSKGASELIDVLMTTAYAPKAEQAPETELQSGMYRLGDEVLKVYRAVHGSGKMVAKRLIVLAEADRYTKTLRGKEVEVRTDWEYLGLATRFVKGHVRMTLEDAKAFGAIYGVCCVCGATLTDEKSIERAIGPVCAGKV